MKQRNALHLAACYLIIMHDTTLAASGELQTTPVFKTGDPVVLHFVYSGGIDNWDASFAVREGILYTYNAGVVSVKNSSGSAFEPNKGKLASAWKDKLMNRLIDVTLDITRLYDLSTPGEYIFEWGCKGVRTEVIRIQITE